jgi:hypothetical protein
MKNSSKLWAIFITILIAVCSVEYSYAIEINATDARGIRRDLPGGDPFLLDFLAVKRDTEDRTVLEFDVTGLAPTPPTTFLILPILDIDPGDPIGTLDVFTFVGNGVITPSDFFAGNFFTTIDINENPPTDRTTSLIDVTVAVENTLAVGGKFLGFRLSTTSSDRFDLGSVGVFLPDPVLRTAVPEPSTISILAIGLLILALIKPLGLVGKGS